MAYYTYVLKSSVDGDNYVGCTNNLKQRLLLHNSGKVTSTSSRRPFVPIYVEIYLNQQDAFTREKFLKTGWGKNYIKRVLKNYFKSRSKKFGG